MKKQAPESRDLRRKALERLGSEDQKSSSPSDVERLLHELEIHRVELEMQNEHLRAAQDELSAGLDRYTQLFDFAPIGYATVAQSGKVLEVNHVGANLLDHSRADIRGKRISLFVAPAYRSAFNAFIDEVMNHHVKKTLKVELARSTGDSPIVQFTADCLAAHVPTLLLAFEGITAQVQAEKRWREADEALRQADRRKDEFLAVLSHELRTPLSSLLMHGQLLRHGGLSEQSVIHSGEVIERAARAQAKLINDLLDVSRIVSGKLTFEQNEVDVRSIVDSALEAVSPEAHKKNVGLEVMVDTGVSTVMGDPGRLVQAVQNLLTNAIKFTPPKGRVYVTVDEADREVRIEVRDTGIGIEADFLPHLFLRFSPGESNADALVRRARPRPVDRSLDRRGASRDDPGRQPGTGPRCHLHDRTPRRAPSIRSAPHEQGSAERRREAAGNQALGRRRRRAHSRNVDLGLGGGGCDRTQRR